MKKQIKDKKIKQPIVANGNRTTGGPTPSFEYRFGNPDKRKHPDHCQVRQHCVTGGFSFSVDGATVNRIIDGMNAIHEVNEVERKVSAEKEEHDARHLNEVHKQMRRMSAHLEWAAELLSVFKLQKGSVSTPESEIREAGRTEFLALWGHGEVKTEH